MRRVGLVGPAIVAACMSLLILRDPVSAAGSPASPGSAAAQTPAQTPSSTAAAGPSNANTSAAVAGAVPATAVDYTKTSPKDLITSTPAGKLSNPYKDSQADVVADGAKNFQRYGCPGCHGGGGGGGMCPPLINDTWVYGGDDDTLFRLVTLGSDDLQKQGYTRKGRENVVGPMPPMGAIITNADDLWKILAFIRFHYNGDPAYKFGAPPE